MKKLKSLLQKHYDIIIYLIFGTLTTAVNYLVYFPCHHLLNLSAVVSNAISWVVAVAFAFVTNKPLVFRSHDWSPKTLLPELWKFVVCRLGSGILETVFIFFAVDCPNWNNDLIEIAMKLIASVFVIIVNYVASKLLVFKKK